MTSGRSCALILAILGFWVTAAAAHPLAPSLLELRERAPGQFEVLWKTPRLTSPGADLVPVLPERCRPTDDPRSERGDSELQVHWTVDCGAASIEGETLSVQGLERSRTAALVRVEFLDGRRLRSLLQAHSPHYRVEPAESAMTLAQSYLRLGAVHIWLGPDHLLFVLGLLFLIQGRRRLIAAITAFTLGHSLTLALAIFDRLRVPSGPVELGIAISLIIVALELCRDEGERESLLRRRPWSVSFAFGLLHGLGFAGALREAGLPSEEIPLALLCFNLGIELGQLAFIALVLSAIVLLRSHITVPARLRSAPAYVIGSLAVFWIIERTRALF